MNLLSVGFGNMGCRHTQSLLGLEGDFTHYIIEPNEEIFNQNLGRIGATSADVIHLRSFDELHADIDFAVIATSASPRFDIVKSLIEKGVKSLLLEKVVFQSMDQFNEIIGLLEDHSVTAYCNFVNRYFPNYRRIKSKLKGQGPISFVVSGGDFGLGCNALHYVDLFEYLTESKVELIDNSLKVNPAISKRGDAYREVLGSVAFKTENGDSCMIIADENFKGGVTITINSRDFTEVLNEETLKHYSLEKGKGVVAGDFEIIYTSMLTAQIYQDIKMGKVLLPSVQETKNAHFQIFQAINPVFGLAEESLCPIT